MRAAVKATTSAKALFAPWPGAGCIAWAASPTRTTRRRELDHRLSGFLEDPALEDVVVARRRERADLAKVSLGRVSGRLVDDVQDPLLHAQESRAAAARRVDGLGYALVRDGARSCQNVRSRPISTLYSMAGAPDTS